MPIGPDETYIPIRKTTRELLVDMKRGRDKFDDVVMKLIQENRFLRSQIQESKSKSRRVKA